METIQFRRMIDDGYGNIHCCQLQDFNLQEINNVYCGIFKLNQFNTIDDFINYLKDIDANQNRDLFDEFIGELDHILEMDEIGNPNGYGNIVDELIGLYKDNVIFKL
jgi:hypothetical protein